MVLSPIRTQEEPSVSLAKRSVPVTSAPAIEAKSGIIERSPRLPEGDPHWQPLPLPDSRLFGTDGIRGKVGDVLTAPLAMQIGFWAGQVLKTHSQVEAPIVIGQDSRNSSTMLSAALAAGLTSAGLEVWNVGLCPTPGVAYLTKTLGAIGGVMISASHNPPEDNGIKFFGADGSKLSLDLQQDIEAALRGQRGGALSTSWGRQHHRTELVAQYQQAVQASLQTTPQLLSSLKVVLDLAWGAAAHLASQTFTDLGAEVICLHDAPDGDRINVNCGSTHLGSLQAAVVAHQADLGFAFDGDADRVLAVAANGRPVDGDYILYLWGQGLASAGLLPGRTIVATVMSNLGFERAWNQQGGQLIRAAVGDQYVHAEMMQHGAMLGGEQSGHILCRHYGVTGDGLLTAVHIANLVQQSGQSLAALVDQSFQTYPQVLKNVRVEDRTRRLNWKECAPLQQVIAQAEADMGDRGRVLVRASGTEPVIRVMVEAATVDLVDYWTETLATAVQRHLIA